MGKKVSHAGKGHYAKYRASNQFSTNKKRKLTKHLKKYPDDNVAKKCLEAGLKSGFSWKRKTPNKSAWSATHKHLANLWKQFGHSGAEYLDYIKMLKMPKAKTKPEDTASA